MFKFPGPNLKDKCEFFYFRFSLFFLVQFKKKDEFTEGHSFGDINTNMAQSKPFLINDYPVIIGIDFGKVLLVFFVLKKGQVCIHT